MNLSPYIVRSLFNLRRRLDGIALVITLLMLSVITFLAIAFLAMSRRNQSSVNAGLDTTTAQTMSQAAQARAMGEIMGQILASGDALQYDYMVSRNAINPAGFYASEKGVYNPTNVNYDRLYSPSGAYLPFNNATNPVGWVQNIANLIYDPRPPVFVVTNQAYPTNYDFRFWVDLNRNGRFETNGYQSTFADEAQHFGSPAVLNGEPEWIGMLRNPLQHHSSTNPFVGRYAYLVLPIGKELDLNYIHNFLKATYGNVGNGNQRNVLTNNCVPGAENDGFARDQGIASWELNLAGLLDNLSPWAYESNNSTYGGYPTAFGPYRYVPPYYGNNNNLENYGNAFDDAEAILHYRYMPPAYTLASLSVNYRTNWGQFYDNFVDIFCGSAPLEPPFDYSGTNYPLKQKYYKDAAVAPWPGSYQTNMFFDPQDLFDPNKTSYNFSNRMMLVSQRTNTYDRYTFQRLLSSIGMGSSPEYGVWVFGDNDFTNPPSQLRTKMNINWDNTAQRTNVNAPYAPMVTNLVRWSPISFFTNAAELLLRSQGFTYSNNYTNAYTINLLHFGVTNIPIYSASYPGIHYDAAVHRMLQLAANLYDATITNQYASSTDRDILPPVRHPTVFRPLFELVGAGTNTAVNITGYVQVTNGFEAIKQLQYPFQDLTNVNKRTFNPNYNVAGIPWIVAADKGLPAFYRYTSASQILFERKLLFQMGQAKSPPLYTNQFYCMAVTNSIGVEGWNPYPTAFYGATNLWYYCSNYVTLQIANGYTAPTTVVVTNSGQLLNPLGRWNAGGGAAGSKAGFLPVFSNTNLVSLPESYYSPSQNAFVYLTNGDNASNSWLKADLGQKSWPVYNWTVSVSNHLVYALFDGDPRSGGAVLDFVNLGPFGSSLSLTNNINTYGGGGNGGLPTGGGAGAGLYWAAGNATSLPGSPMSAGVLNQIQEAEYVNPTWALNLAGRGSNADVVLGCPFNPSWVIQQPTNWVVNDPLVHYTVEDLTWLGNIQNDATPYDVSHSDTPLTPSSTVVPLLNSAIGVGTVSKRYAPWGVSDGVIPGTGLPAMLFKDPLITTSEAWDFPTTEFPSVGWIGRVHRGTPWQTVFLKADTSLGTQWVNWAKWANPNYINGLAPPEMYPTNDYPLVDLFTAVPNDNAAHGLLSVNQTNDPAWAAVFAGVIALTNAYGGTPIAPNDIQYIMDATNGINALRTNQPNGIFHKVGYILAAPALTVASPYLPTNSVEASQLTDEMIERIPQQTLSLLKVGEPQFTIFSWGQALKPKGPPYLGLGANAGMYTNYEITGEFLTRTVCHLVHTNGNLKMVIDSYNVESGN
jgi:hypothetical protein